MRPMLAFMLLSLFSLGLAEDTTTDGYNDKFNTIEPKPSVRLDPYIRKALLKALSDLEDSTTTGSELDETTGSDSDAYTLGDAEPDAQTDKKGIQIHSFVVNGQAAFASNSTNTPAIVDNNISILSTTTGNVESQVTATLPTSAPFSEIFQTKESSSNFLQTRSIAGTSKLSTESSVTTKKPVPKPVTTTTTTTTTTPKPTHNDDGENIEEVNQRDVQVYQAPLVAAFTVHQDPQGLPKKVIPLYQQSNTQTHFMQSLPATNLASGVSQSQSLGQLIPSVSLNHIPQSEYINQQLVLQRQLEEKQRILEEQLRLLQQQQKQQEELLRKQQYLLQQKDSQRQQLLLSSQKYQAQGSVNNFQVQKNVPQNQFINHNTQIRPNNGVSIQPSVPLELSNTVTNQQLPNREAVDFLIHLHSQQPDQFPLQENHLPQGISNFLHPNSGQTFHQGVNFNQVRPDQFSQQKQSHRVFRHDSGVGNFGLNNQNFNTFTSINPTHANRFFPPNAQNQYKVDAELKQLLLQNGLNGRNQEDLNIVSKVLSLNHGVLVNNNISNRLPFDSRRHVRPLI